MALTKKKAGKIKTKVCVRCGKTFVKVPRASGRQWAARKYCSFQCRKLTTKERDVRAALRSYSSLKERGLCPWCHTPNTEEGVYHKRCSRKRLSRYKEQNRNRALLKLYGINRKQYDSLLLKQASKCAICGGTSGKRMLSVDHDHTTGIIRGLLCDNCNHGLGKFQDSAELLEEAIAYLRKHG